MSNHQNDGNAHGHEHEHDHGHELNHGHDNGHTHDHEHNQGHTHDHDHEHDQGHTHDHGHSHEHPHAHPHDHPEAATPTPQPTQRTVAVMTYTLEHNRHHAEELSQLADELEAAGEAQAAGLLRQGVHFFAHGNEKLSEALSILKER